MMKTYKMKRVVVGIVLVILTLGFCVVGTGAARPGAMGGPDGGQHGFGPDRQNGPFGGEAPDFDGELPADGELPPDGDFDPDGRGGFGGRGGHGRDRGFGPMDEQLREAIEALEDGEVKTELLALLDKLQDAMETLRSADETSRESAEAALQEAREALDEALSKAGIEITPPEMPAGDRGMTPPDGDMTPPEKPDGDSGMVPPEKPDGDSRV